MNDKPIAVLDQQKSRRGLLTLAFAGGAAALAALLGRSNGAQAGHDGGTDEDALHLGQENTAPADSKTVLNANINANPAFQVINNNDGSEGVSAAVEGRNDNGRGVIGISESQEGVHGESGNGTGVGGFSESGAAGSFHSPNGHGLLVSGRVNMDAELDDNNTLNVFNTSTSDDAGAIWARTFGGVSGAAVLGQSSLPGEGFPPEGIGIGVWGQSGSGPGVLGESQIQDGVRGSSDSGGGVNGFSNTGNGVGGFSNEGVGVVGQGWHGEGVTGRTADPDKAGVLGESTVAGPCIDPETGEELPKGPCFEFGGSSTGVLGRSATGRGVSGESETGTGVLGGSQDGPGVQGNSQTGTGVSGGSQTGIGVAGFSVGEELLEKTGVLGFGSTGVFGFRPVDGSGAGASGAAPGSAPGVLAISGTPIPPDPEPKGFWFPEGPSQIEPDGGLALDVIGKARFSTAGGGSVPQGQSSVFVPNEAVTADSHVTVTLASNPGSRQLHWVEKDPSVGFTVHLTFAPPPQRPETAFTYLIVEPA